MQKTSDFLGIPAICLEDGAVVGNVKNVYFDENAKQAIYLGVCADKLTLIPYDKILAAKDAVVLSSKADLCDCIDVDFSALCTLDGKDVFSGSGERRGKIQSVELFKGGKTNKLLTEDEAFALSAFTTFGDVLVLKPAKKRTVKRTLPRDKTNRKVQIFEPTHEDERTEKKEARTDDSSYESNAQNDPAGNATYLNETAPAKIPPLTINARGEVLPKPAVQIENSSPLFSQDALERIVGKEIVYQDDERTPARVITDYDFLLGRTLLRDLFSYANTLIAKAGTIVTKDLVETSARYGKLVELTLNSAYR